MISFPAFLVAKESGGATAWVWVQLNGQPHLAIFSTSHKAAEFAASQTPGRHIIRRIAGAAELSRELINLPTVLHCVIDYIPGEGTQRAVLAEVLIRLLV